MRVGVIAKAAALILCGAIVAVGVVIYQMGTLRVSIHEKKKDGVNLNLVVPAAAVPLGLLFVPHDNLQDAARELRSWLPVVEVAAEELARCPDGVFVEVHNSREHVTITKHRGALLVRVDNPNETVHVSFPLKIVAATARRIKATEFAGPETAKSTLEGAPGA